MAGNSLLVIPRLGPQAADPPPLADESARARDITELRILPPAAVRREHFAPGETLFHQGDVGDRIYFVVSGEAEIELDGRVVGTAGPGGVIGEIALVRDTPRTATVRVKTPMDTASAQPRDVPHAGGALSRRERGDGRGDAEAPGGR